MRSIGLSVEEWYALAKEGTNLPVEITLAGDSMQPLIRKNRDVVTILPLEGSPEVGDIVLFRRFDGAFVVHRVYRLHGDVVITLGDNCENPDPPLPGEQVLGKVTEIRRGKKTIIPGKAAERQCGRIWMKLLPIRKRVLHLKYVIKKNAGRKTG